MKSSLGVTTGVGPVCNQEHPVRKVSVGPGDIHVMDAHRTRGSDGPWCRGEGLEPERISPGCA